MKIIRSNRKTIAIEIKSDATVLVRAPYFMKDAEIDKFINEKEHWIKKHLEKVQKQQVDAKEVQKLTMEEVRQLADLALKVISEKVRYYAEIMNVHYGRVSALAERAWKRDYAKNVVDYIFWILKNRKIWYPL